MYLITGSLIHHTTDNNCCTADVPYVIPAFFVEADNEEDALVKAKAIVCPMRLEYEAVTVTVKAMKLCTKDGIETPDETVKKVGHDKKKAKHVTCNNCGAKLEYYPKDVKRQSVSCMGESEVVSWVACPDCKSHVTAN